MNDNLYFSAFCLDIPGFIPIPEIEDQCYLEKDYDGAMFRLMHSMRFEGMGMYGDFGRYVFQSAYEYAWVDVQIKTGEYEIVTETVQVPDFSPIEALLCKYSGLAEAL